MAKAGKKHAPKKSAAKKSAAKQAARPAAKPKHAVKPHRTAPKRAAPKRPAAKRGGVKSRTAAKPKARKATAQPRTAPKPRIAAKPSRGAARPAPHLPAPGRGAAPTILTRPIAPLVPAARGEPELRVGDEAVLKATGKDWAEWCGALDAAGAQTLPHSDIARLVMERFRLGPWWSQMVTVGYEQARGLSDKHQKSDGYEISVSKTVSAPAERVYGAWNQDAERMRWLGQNLKVRTVTPVKSIRLTGSDGISIVAVALAPKGAGKTHVSVQHTKLKDADEAARMKSHWTSALERLRAAVEVR